MPTLLRSSETKGCGATIKLDSGEVVIVSIARVGVLVRHWDMSGGFFKTLISNFTGAKLYNETNVYKNAQTARALSMKYPEQAPELQFTNPVLGAFSNAIWQCGSAAEVCTVLNEAAAKIPEAAQSQPKRSPEMTPAPKTVDEVISAYGALIEKHPAAIMDVAMLPAPKKQMKVLLKALYAKATTTELQNHIEVVFTLLSQFQEGVGPTPIDAVTFGDKPTQADIAKLDKWSVWHKLSIAEAEALLGEWKRFLAGEPI
jgi:hypothetical protein